MKKLVLCLLVLTALAVNGCTLTGSVEDRNRRIARICDTQIKMAVDDIDYALLLDENAQTSRYYIRHGAPD